MAAEPLLDNFSRAPSFVDDVKSLDHQVNKTRDDLVESGEKAVVQLCFAALEHAAEGVTHTNEKISAICTRLTDTEKGGGLRNLCDMGCSMAKDVFSWMRANPIKTILMIGGLGGTIFKATTIKNKIADFSEGFVKWCSKQTRWVRFAAFVALMVCRLFVSTLVPPTSPAFAVIISAATPEDEKWTSMPFFLLASTIAGVTPWLMDKLFQLCFGRDFVYTKSAKAFADFWPLTCWTGPAMYKVYATAGGGKFGSSLAVIVAHAAPFMGAQTTQLQRYFLPHPLDTIISQPFGMSEDLISMALAEAGKNTPLASKSLSYIMCFFNFWAFWIVSQKRDVRALFTLLINIYVGYNLFIWVSNPNMLEHAWLNLPNITHGAINITKVDTLVLVVSLFHEKKKLLGYGLVGLQLFVQMFIVPSLSHCFVGRNKPLTNNVEPGGTINAIRVWTETEKQQLENQEKKLKLPKGDRVMEKWEDVQDVPWKQEDWLGGEALIQNCQHLMQGMEKLQQLKVNQANEESRKLGAEKEAEIRKLNAEIGEKDKEIEKLQNRGILDYFVSPRRGSV